jgi:predicted RNase H-like HicB family nuclease
MRYLIVIEKAATGFSAYSPDLPGCVSTGSTHDEIEKNIREAIEFHVAGFRQEGYELPLPSTYSIYVDVPA